MKRGELSNEILPRVYLVFEDLVGLLPDTKTKVLASVATKRKKWETLANYYQLNIPTSGGMRDLYWRHRFRVDVITYIDPSFVSPMRDRLDSRNLLFGDVHYYSREELKQDLIYDPSIIGVLDPDPMRALAYGSKGKYCPPDKLDLLKILI